MLRFRNGRVNVLRKMISITLVLLLVMLTGGISIAKVTESGRTERVIATSDVGVQSGSGFGGGSGSGSGSGAGGGSGSGGGFSSGSGFGGGSGSGSGSSAGGGSGSGSSAGGGSGSGSESSTGSGAGSGSVTIDNVTKGGSTGINIIVNVNGLAEGIETTITLEKKVEEGEIPVILIKDTVNHSASFSVEAGGSCTISGALVPGYNIPSAIDLSLTKVKGSFSIIKTLIYEEGNIDVEGVSLNKERLMLLVGQKETLKAKVSPGNANNQEVKWTSSNEAVAKVDTTGIVEAKGTGIANIIVTIEGESFSDACTVIVDEINSVYAIENIYAATGELVTLPSLVKVSLLNSGDMFVPVTWPDASMIDGNQVIKYNNAGNRTLIGEFTGTTLTAIQNIIVTGNAVDEITTIRLDKANLSVYIAKQVELKIINYTSSAADLNTLFWYSSVPSVVEISSISADGSTATLTGNKAGTSVVIVKTWDGKILDACLVSVAVDPTLTDPVYIKATTAESDVAVDQFESRDAVYIRGYNLPIGYYNVKVEAKGSGIALGETIQSSRVHVTEITEDFMFNLMDVVYNAQGIKGFDPTDSFSNSYFVSMSLEPSYPHGDYDDGVAIGTPKTLVDNFKIGSPVPTGDIEVTVIEGFDNGNGVPSSSIVGKGVYLAREISGISAFDTQLEDYINPYYNPAVNATIYTDEIKMYGTVNASGEVDWETPKESLKIGGYILLMDLPSGYRSNLDEVNPLSEDGELLKEVHIERDTKVTRQIMAEKSIGILNYESLSLYIDSTSILTATTDNPAYVNLQWESANVNVATVMQDPTDEKSATIKGIGAGTTRINLKNGNGIFAFCIVNVAIDPTIMDPAYIVATTNNNPESVDQFNDRDEVWIRGYGLPAGDYYVKVEDKGSNLPLGVSETTFKIIEGQEEIGFYLNQIAPFELTDSFSASYFVSMSTSNEYPTGDDENGLPKTFVDNFKIGSPVPTGFIEVDVTQLRSGMYSAVDPRMIGKDIILARVIDENNVFATQYEDYLNPIHAMYPELSIYTDEVKLVGHILENGEVKWDIPKEKLKIGGYLLLIEFPSGHNYVSNLDQVNPESEDGELLKEVHITRQASTYRLITIQNKDLFEVID